MAYEIISQNNTVTTLADENGNVITVPSRSILEAGTTFTLVKINNNTATLEDSNGNVYRDIPCCIDLTQVTGFNVTKVNNNKATVEDGDGKVYAGVPCIVNLTESGGGGSAVIDPLNVTPSTSAQTITATGGVDGYSPVNVSAVDASIDANITAGNIKSGATILGVTGNVVELNGETKTVTPQVYGQTLYPTSPKNAITEITVNAVTSSIDANITAGNIKKDVTILGVTGTYEGGGGGSGLAVPLAKSAEGYLVHDTSYPTVMDFSTITGIYEAYVLATAYRNNTTISGTVDMGNVLYIDGSSSCANLFQGCTGITGVNLSKLRAIGSNACSLMFSGSSVTSANLSELLAINSSNGCASMFEGCPLTSINLSKLIYIGATGSANSMFKSTNITTASLPSFKSSTASNTMAYMFSDCANLTSLYFPSVTSSTFGTRINQLTGLCLNVPNVTIHFPANTQAKIESMTGYSTTAPFGAVSGTVLFDLPSTVTLTGANSVDYERCPKDDTATALAWRLATSSSAYDDVDWTPYYTSGTTDPAVSDTIYSDAACTTPVTTISSIA